MKRSNRKKKGLHQDIARKRIEELFKQAQIAKSDDLANRYAEMAHKISLKFKVSFTKSQKQSYCKKCKSYLRKGYNCRIRLNEGKVVVKCLNCGNIRRFVYK